MWLQSGIYGRSSTDRQEAQMLFTLTTLVARDRTLELLEDAARRRTGRPPEPSSPRLRKG